MDDLNRAKSYLLEVVNWRFQTRLSLAESVTQNLLSQWGSRSSTLPGVTPMNPSVARSAGMPGEASSVAAGSAAVSGKCTRRFAPSVVLIPRFLSYPEATDQSTAAIASAQCVVSL